MSDAPLDPSLLALTVTCPKGLEALLADELTQCGWQAVRQRAWPGPFGCGLSRSVMESLGQPSVIDTGTGTRQ